MGLIWGSLEEERPPLPLLAPTYYLLILGWLN
jgi:hypothetical protein